MGRILLIEADKENPSTVGFMLHMDGYQVVFSETLEEGLNRYNVYRGTCRSFDLVLLVADSRQLSVLTQVDFDLLGTKLIIVHKNRHHADPLVPHFGAVDLRDSERIHEMVKLQLGDPGKLDRNAATQICRDNAGNLQDSLSSNQSTDERTG